MYLSHSPFSLVSGGSQHPGHVSNPAKSYRQQCPPSSTEDATLSLALLSCLQAARGYEESPENISKAQPTRNPPVSIHAQQYSDRPSPRPYMSTNFFVAGETNGTYTSAEAHQAFAKLAPLPQRPVVDGSGPSSLRLPSTVGCSQNLQAFGTRVRGTRGVSNSSSSCFRVPEDVSF